MMDYKMTYLTGNVMIKPSRYRLRTRVCGWFGLGREYELECIETGFVLSGLDKAGLAEARKHMFIVGED